VQFGQTKHHGSAFRFKGIVQRKLTGVESGINRKGSLQAKVTENVIKICPSPILCKAKTFSAICWHYSLDVTVAFHVGTKNLQWPLNLNHPLLTSATNFCH
jgi:hypothetical protein